MGACLCSAVRGRRLPGSPTAIIISSNGNLRQYTVPVTVSHVLLMEFPTSPSSSLAANNNDDLFVCNSDSLRYDQYIPTLDAEHQLEAHQIYFVLPTSKLEHPLSASEMVALAVKASVALQTTTLSSTIKKQHRLRHRQNRVVRVSPILDEAISTTHGDYPGSHHVMIKTMTTISYKQQNGWSQPIASAGRSGSSVSARKLQRFSSRRFKLAARSFRLRLTTIYEEEGSLLQF